jgi:hypothetical protein
MLRLWNYWLLPGKRQGHVEVLQAFGLYTPTGVHDFLDNQNNSLDNQYNILIKLSG